MRWPYIEYLFKGLFLGLILFAGLQMSHDPEGSPAAALLRFNLPMLAGLLLVLVITGTAKLREGYRIKGRLLVFLFFLLLDSPTQVYAGIFAGAILGASLIQTSAGIDWLWPIVGGGAVLGIGFILLRLIRARLIRLSVILVLASALAIGLYYWLGQGDEGARPLLKNPSLLAIQLLLGLPFFYVLTFAGRTEETEVEIGAMCAALGVSLSILTSQFLALRSLSIIVPVFLYLGYTMFVLPALRVIKHVFRGLSHVRIGRHREALQAFRRALQLDPNNSLARDGFWEVHRSLDLDQLKNDPHMRALVDLDLCLSRAGSLLIQGKPTPAQMAEAQSLLTLVLSQRPELKPSVVYWQAVAHTHSREFDKAAAELESLLDPHPFGRHNPERQKILLSAWQLVLLLHDELRRRVGAPQLAQPGRRMEAIAVVERHLAENPDDQAVWNLKRVLYQDVNEAEYDAEARTWPQEEPADPNAPPTSRFDHAYVQQLGLALINDNERWKRGGEYLRMAAHGQPAQGVSLFVEIGQAHLRNGNKEDALRHFELAKRAGRSVGPKNLDENEAQIYYGTVKYLGDVAQAKGDIDAAIENYRLYVEAPHSGLETLRNLADLCERKGDVLSALRFNDMALVYNSADKDLLERKDRYYYSVMPDVLQARLDSVRDGFDWSYCIRKTQTILDNPAYSDVEWLDVAHHLTQLALVLTPESRRARLLLARIKLRLGERDGAMELLEQVRTPRPETFPTGDEEDAWYVSSQILGDLYMEVGRPDLAVACFNDFRKSHRSGARTLYKLGQAHEQLGDPVKAARYYKQVTGYEGNPLVYDAQAALSRLGS